MESWQMDFLPFFQLQRGLTGVTPSCGFWNFSIRWGIALQEARNYNEFYIIKYTDHWVWAKVDQKKCWTIAVSWKGEIDQRSFKPWQSWLYLQTNNDMVWLVKLYFIYFKYRRHFCNGSCRICLTVVGVQIFAKFSYPSLPCFSFTEQRLTELGQKRVALWLNQRAIKLYVPVIIWQISLF